MMLKYAALPTSSELDRGIQDDRHSKPEMAELLGYPLRYH